VYNFVINNYFCINSECCVKYILKKKKVNFDTENQFKGEKKASTHNNLSYKDKGALEAQAKYYEIVILYKADSMGNHCTFGQRYVYQRGSSSAKQHKILPTPDTQSNRIQSLKMFLYNSNS